MDHPVGGGAHQCAVVAGEQHAAAGVLFCQQPCRQPAAPGPVEALLRLVEQQKDPGSGKARRQREAPALPARQAGGKLVGSGGKTSLGQELRGVLIGRVVAMRAGLTHDYLGTRGTIVKNTHWGTLDGGARSLLFSGVDGRDACGQQSAREGLTLGSGHAQKAIIAPGGTGYDEYRVSCGKQSLPDRRIAIYR